MAIDAPRSLELLAAGFSIIPVKSDGSKSPALPSFEGFMKKPPTEDEVVGWFADGKNRGGALICGAVSGNLIVFDFERKDLFTAWSEILETEDVSIADLPIVETPRGFHVYTRIPEPQRGRKLAREAVEVETRDGKTTKGETIIELRGEGQYIVAEGTDGDHHPLGDKTDGWKLKWGPDVTETPEITLRQFETMARIAMSFNTWADKAKTRTGLGKIPHGDDRPGTDYCQRGEWHDLLERNDWTILRTDRSGREIWARPGKEDPGGSATLGFCTTELGDALFVFSTNAHPLEAEACYSLFAAKAFLEHGGDFREAGRACVIEGYGKRADAEVRELVATQVEAAQLLLKTGGLERLVGDQVIDNWLALSPEFKKVWNRKRADWESEPSRYDNFLLWFANEYTDPGQVNPTLRGIALVHDFRAKFQDQPEKAFDVEYVSRKVGWILNKPTRESQRALATIEEGEAGDTRERRLHDLSRRLEVPVVQVIQYTIDTAVWVIRVKDGDDGAVKAVKLGTTEDLLNPKKIEAALMSHEIDGYPGVLDASVKAAVGWDVVRRHLYAVREIEERGETLAEQLRYYISRYLDSRGKIEEGEDDYQQAIATERPFVTKEGLLHVHGPNLKRWVSNFYRESIAKDFTFLMRWMGFESVKVSVWHDGKVVCRAFWAIQDGDFVGIEADDDHVPGLDPNGPTVPARPPTEEEREPEPASG